MAKLTFDDLLVKDAPVTTQSGGLDFSDLTPTTTPKVEIPTTQPSENNLTRQFFKTVFEQAPFGKRILSNFPEREKYYAETPKATSVPEKIASGAGSLTGMLPSFSAGGLAGGPVGGVATKVAGKFLPSIIAKAVGLSAGGATTFAGAKALQNIGQNKPVQQGTIENAKMGAMFGPTGAINSRLGSTIAATTLGAMTAPKGEKLPQAILFGGLQALTHATPDLSKQELGRIDNLYQEATAKEGLREIKEKIQNPPKQLPTIKQNLRPISKQGVVTVQSDLTPIPQPNPTGEGREQIGGIKIETDRGAMPGEPLQTLGDKATLIETEEGKYYIQRADESKVYNPKTKNALFDNTDDAWKQFKLSTPTGEIKPLTIKTPQVEASQSPKEFYAKIKVGEEWTVPGEGERTFKSGKFIKSKSKKMTSEKAIDLLRKTLKNPIISEEGDYMVIRGQGGFTNLDWLQPLEQPFEYAKKGITQIYRGLAPSGEVLRNDKLVNSIMAERQRKISEINSGTLPESLKAQRIQEVNSTEPLINFVNKTGGKDESLMVSTAANAIDKERAFKAKYANIVDLAQKVGITPDSKASETIFKVLDYRRATPEDIAKLTPEQQKFIPIFRNAYKDIWQRTGKPDYEGIRDYATHLINDGLEKGYDISPIGRFLPDELYSRFFEQRKGGQPYQQDIIKAFDTYVPNVARKIYREPVLDMYNQFEPHLNKDFKNEATDYMESFLGRGRYRGEQPLGNLPKDLVRTTYQGTLYGNFSATIKNATQVLTNTVPEIGKYTGDGLKKFMTESGRREFEASGLAGDFSIGKPIDQLDFFSQVEYLNRGITYLGAKAKALAEGMTGSKAEYYAKKIVRKTQFIQTGIDTPKFYRQMGGIGRAIGQFSQFPTKQGFLLTNWAKNKEYGKLARFATIAYMLGGTEAFPFLNRIISWLPEDEQKKLDLVEKYTSLSGMLGLNIGQNFGLGIYGNGVPLGRGPAIGLFTNAAKFGQSVANREITNPSEAFRSPLIQKSLPTLIPGGVAMKKTIDLINADINDYKVRNANDEFKYRSSPKEEVTKVLIGSTKERQEAQDSLREQKNQDLIYKNDHRRLLDTILSNKNPEEVKKALTIFITKYPNYDTSTLSKELIGRVKSREIPSNIKELLHRPKALR